MNITPPNLRNIVGLCFLLLLSPLAGMAEQSNIVKAPNPGFYFPKTDFTTVKPSPSLAFLPIRGFQQTTEYTCGPAIIVSLLKYYGMEGNELTMAKEMGTRPGSGTHPLAMVNWLKGHGFDVEWGEETLGDGSGMKMIRKNLEAGIPIIVEWIDWGGHYGLTVGHDNRGTPSVDDDVLLLADPYDRYDEVADGITVFNAERFYYMWFDAHCFDRPMTRVWIKAVPKGNVRKDSGK